MTQDALERFNRYVVEDGLTAEQAYVRTIAKIGTEKIPDIFSPNLVPLNFDISNMTDAIKKKPDGFFDELNNALAVKYRTGEITRSEFLEDIARVDLLKDVFEVRRKAGGVNNGQMVGFHTPDGSNYRAKNGGSVISNAFDGAPRS